MKNLTLTQYARLPDTSGYDALLDHLKPRNSFGGKTMETSAMPYANVKYAIRMLRNLNSWEQICSLFAICYGVDEKTFWRSRIAEYFPARRFLLQELERIIMTEAKLLDTQSTDAHLWHMAGADRLTPYSDTLPLLQLGKLFGQYPYDLGRRPYGEIFSLLAQTKAQNEVETEYQKLARS